MNKEYSEENEVMVVRYRCEVCRLSKLMISDCILEFLSSSGCCPQCGERGWNIFDIHGNNLG